MSLVGWNSTLITGIFEIDNQHKVLMQAMTNLHSLLSIGGSRGSIEHAIQSFSEAIVKNFETEENLMLAEGYHSYKTHKTQHEEFEDRVVHLIKDFNTLADGAFLAAVIESSIAKQLVGHIRNADKDLATFINKNSDTQIA